MIISSTQVSLLVAFTVAWWSIRRVERQLASTVSNLFFTFVLVWKFSSILIYFDYVRQTPMAVLYYNGGEWGLRLAVLAVLIQLFFYGKKYSQISSLVFPAWLVLLTSLEAAKLIQAADTVADALLAGVFLVLLVLIWPKENRFLNGYMLVAILIFQWMTVWVNGDFFTEGLFYSGLFSLIVFVLYRRRKRV
ncbi:hypothetical protein [Jeotgalibacillus sp. R-1-5s-1]|uniref:hypothetical protein n=1 Tax=Jeotgalibacillus sp. R-1-5s-1 TaxID=2555897 RepID=UPI00106C4A60|nr:hypothetical protein [Jeotgalibacillus sp. R-1-5s-1]TFD96597.1 hypothetical protein E2491_10750 [Jeotgalibacillus sp. R-1-5s-1]